MPLRWSKRWTSQTSKTNWMFSSPSLRNTCKFTHLLNHSWLRTCIKSLKFWNKTWTETCTIIHVWAIVHAQMKMLLKLTLFFFTATISTSKIKNKVAGKHQMSCEWIPPWAPGEDAWKNPNPLQVMHLQPPFLAPFWAPGPSVLTPYQQDLQGHMDHVEPQYSHIWARI